MTAFDPKEKLASVELRSDAVNDIYKKPLYEWSKKKQLLVFGGTVAVLLVIAGGIFAVYKKTGSGPSDSISQTNGGPFGGLPFSDNQPVASPAVSTSISGLSGRSCEEANRRPIGVMLSSDLITRPVSGFAQADFVWELPVLTNDVTRFLAVYQCGRPGEIGSVRSVRHDYLFLAQGMDAIIGHWGGSYHALNRIAAGEFQTINALQNPFNTYFRKNTLPAPYNGFTTYDKLWTALQGLTYRTTTNFTGYQFKDDIEVGQRPTGGSLSVGWPGAFQVRFEYDPATNHYQRFWAGAKQVDGEDKAPVAPSSVVVMKATNGPMTGPGGYNDVGIEGQGAMTVYQDGKVITGTWKKNELEKKDPTHFLNDKGEPIIFTRGQIWVMAVEPSVAVSWEAK